MKTGWFLLEGSWYYAPDNGAILQNGFGIIAAKDAGGQEKLAYFEASGSLRMHSFDIGKKNYIVNGSGYIVQTVLHGISYYSQRDPRWANVLIGSSYLGMSGCVVTNLTSVVNYFTNTNYTPVDIGHILHDAGIYNPPSNNGSTSNAYGYIANYFGLTYRNALSYQDVVTELLKGKVIVGAVGPGEFTIDPYTHGLLIYGYDENGYVMVHDPYNSQKTKKYPLSLIWNQRSDWVGDNMDYGPFYSLGI